MLNNKCEDTSEVGDATAEAGCMLSINRLSSYLGRAQLAQDYKLLLLDS